MWSIDVVSVDGSLRGAYFVDQDGQVTADSVISLSDFRLCDGRGVEEIDCDDVPIVIDETGACAGGIYGSCTGAAGVPYHTAKEVEAMIKDVVGGPIDLGIPNSANGGMVDIMVVDATDSRLNGATAGYARGTSPGRATLLIGLPSATDPGAPAHELGHAAHATFSDVTFYLPTGTMTVPQKVEHMAIVEFIGEMVELAYRNYNGSSASPKFDSSPTWISRGGYSYSSVFTHSQMSMVDDLDTPYANARVGGHAMFELVTALGYEVAFRAFAGAVNNLDDDNNSDAVSWQEFRNAMTYWAVLNGGGATLYAIMDAWHAVGVGDSSTGQHNPPTDYDPGAPPVPTVSYLLDEACISSETWYDLYHSSSGATYYRIFGSTNGINGPYQYEGEVYSSPTPMYTVGGGHVKVQACASNACSLLSQPIYLAYMCP